MGSLNLNRSFFGPNNKLKPLNAHNHNLITYFQLRLITCRFPQHALHFDIAFGSQPPGHFALIADYILSSQPRPYKEGRPTYPVHDIGIYSQGRHQNS